MPIEIQMPALSPTMEDGTLAKWLIAEGDSVQSGDVIAEIETDKATMEFEAADDGTLGKILVSDGTGGVAVGDPIAILLLEGETEADLVTAASETPAPAQDTPADAAPVSQAPDRSGGTPTSKGARVFASPLARRIAEQAGLDLTTLSGSGPRGRIVKMDVETALAAGASQGASAGPADAPRPVAPAIAGMPTDLTPYRDRPHTEISLDGMRRTVATRLTQAKQTIPHFYLRRTVVIDPLLELRAQLNAQLAAREIKLSVNDFVIKACAAALQHVPAANAIWADDRILQMQASDIAVAVAVDGGLFTPVLLDAQSKSLSTLSTEMKDLASRARTRKLAPQEYQGGSFAISNLGMYGVESFDAVINPPHGAILAVGAGTKTPAVAKDGSVGVATQMVLTLSVDHRVMDGAIGATLLAAIAEYLEAPLTMLA